MILNFGGESTTISIPPGLEVRTTPAAHLVEIHTYMSDRLSIGNKIKITVFG